jgi:hypothetical protein
MVAQKLPCCLHQAVTGSLYIGIAKAERRRNDMQHEREIDALLSNEVSDSIIDRLLALPRPAAASQAASEWDRAVASRFETHLARQMRAILDQGDSDRNAA